MFCIFDETQRKAQLMMALMPKTIIPPLNPNFLKLCLQEISHCMCIPIHNIALHDVSKYIMQEALCQLYWPGFNIVSLINR